MDVADLAWVLFAETLVLIYCNTRHGGCFFCFESSVMCSVLFCDEHVLNGSKAGQGNYRLKDLQCDFMYKYFVGKKASHMQIADFFFFNSSCHCRL